MLLPFTTYRCAPSAATATAVGYQPVGMSATVVAPVALAGSRLTTATAFVPPHVT
jgi:hypothetical protein